MTVTTDRLRHPTPQQSAAIMLADVDSLTAVLVDRILAAEHSYLESTLLTPEQLYGACLDNLTSMLGSLSGGGEPNLDSARAAGRLKAEQGVPLAALLHAFRLGGRLIWEELMLRADGQATESLLSMVAEVWALVDVCSDVAAEAYRETADLRAQQDSESRGRLVRVLFADHESNPVEFLDAVRTLRIADRGVFVVVSIDAASTDTLHTELVGTGVTSVWDAQIDGLIGLLCAPTTTMLDAGLRALGNEPRSIGVSNVFHTPTGISEGVEQSRLARKCAGNTLNRYDASPVALLLARDPDAAKIAADQIFGPLLQLPPAEQQNLLGTLDAWFANRGSTTAAAAQVHYHRNTVLYRLRRIQELTGRDFMDPVGASELYVGREALRARE